MAFPVNSPVAFFILDKKAFMLSLSILLFFSHLFSMSIIRTSFLGLLVHAANSVPVVFWAILVGLWVGMCIVLRTLVYWILYMSGMRYAGGAILSAGQVGVPSPSVLSEVKAPPSHRIPAGCTKSNTPAVTSCVHRQKQARRLNYRVKIERSSYSRYVISWIDLVSLGF
jgi:hypothetical protein